MSRRNRGEADAKCTRCDNRTCRCPADLHYDKLMDDEDARIDAAAERFEHTRQHEEGRDGYQKD